MIKGILFDKDGTLLNFEKLWLDAAKYVVWDFCFINHLPVGDEVEGFLLKTMGIEGNTIRQDGPLAYMTYEQIGATVARALQNTIYKDLPEKLQRDFFVQDTGISEELASRQIQVLFETVLEREALPCIPTCNLKELFARLQKKDIRIGLVTADNAFATEKCLKQLGIEKEFDFIGCDDGILKPKPEPDMFWAFCEQCNLRPGEIAVVGDTVNDMHFAKNCGGMAVGTLSGLAAEEDFLPFADRIIQTPEEILQFI